MQIRHVNLTATTTIWCPEVETVYHIPCSHSPTNDIEITFAGDELSELIAINVSTGQYLIRTSDKVQRLSFDPNVFLSAALLPPSYCRTKLPTVAMYSPDTNQIEGVYKIHYDLSKNDAQYQVDMNCIMQCGDSRPFELKPYNESLKEMCQTLARFIPVISSELPIFIDEKRPSVEYLDNLYQQFIAYNNNIKLEFQLTNSRGQCHVRAYFLNMLFRHYGISSANIFKFYETKQWSKFSKDRCWIFHEAVLVMDDKNKLWIFDPWIDNKKDLLSVREWLFKMDEPTPISCLIGSTAIALDPFKPGSYGTPTPIMGRCDSASALMTFGGPYVKSLQAVIGSAIPNPIYPFIKLKPPKKSYPLLVHREAYQAGSFFSKQGRNAQAEEEREHAPFEPLVLRFHSA